MVLIDEGDQLSFFGTFGHLQNKMGKPLDLDGKPKEE